MPGIEDTQASKTDSLSPPKIYISMEATNN
jgi:hypothetical protein